MNRYIKGTAALAAVGVRSISQFGTSPLYVFSIDLALVNTGFITNEVVDPKMENGVQANRVEEQHLQVEIRAI